MSNKRWGITFAVSAITAASLVACGGGSGSSGASTPPPTLSSAQEGDGQVTLKWTAASGIAYWVWWLQSATGLTIATAGNSRTAAPDFVVSGVNNSLPYSFGVNSHAGSANAAGGPLSNVLTTTPRLAPAAWLSGSGLSGDIYGVAFGNNGTVQSATGETVHPYLAVGAAGAIYTSPDALTWSTWTPNSSTCNSAGNNLRGAAYASSNFVAVGDGGTICLSGVTSTNAAANALISSVDATTTSSTYNYWSPKLANWTAATTNPVASTVNLNAVSSNQYIWNGSGSFVAVGTAGTVIYSADGQTWTTSASSTATTNTLNGVGYNSCGLPNLNWIAVGANNTIYGTTDASGSSGWTTSGITVSGLPSGTTLRSVACTANTQQGTTPGTLPAATTPLWVAVGDNGYVVTSSDGLTWTAAQSLGTATMRSVWYGTQFVAVGDGGVAYTSQNGTTWTAKSTGTSANLYAVIAPPGTKQYWDPTANAATKIPNGTKGAIFFGYAMVGAGGSTVFGY